MKKFILFIIVFSLLLGASSCKKGSSEKQIEESVRQFDNRPIYKELTKEIIDAASDDDLVQLVYDNICARFAPDYSDDFEVVSYLSPGQQAVYATWWVEAEVNNGGFNQYYFNSDNRFSEMAVDGFELIGAHKHAALMIEANRVYKENEKELKAIDKGSVKDFSDSYKNNPLDKLDEKFYQLDESIGELSVKYIREHYQEFIK